VPLDMPMGDHAYSRDWSTVGHVICPIKRLFIAISWDKNVIISNPGPLIGPGPQYGVLL